jgi:rod shape-determining protein MreD
MRWIPFAILAYLVVLLQTTVGRFLTFTPSGIGSIGPDLAALLAVFIACRVRSWPDAILAAWALGLAVDLTTGGGVGAGPVVGPMALAYALVAALLFRVREAFFRERALTQVLLAAAFCVLAHAAWVTVQSLLAWGAVSWSAYGRTLLQAALLAAYTGLLMPLAHVALARIQRWFLAAPVAARGRGRR